MSLAATPREIAAFRSDGYFVRERVFAAAELEPLRAAVERVHASVVSASGAPAAGAVERIDGRRFQDVLGACVKWEWDESAEIRSMEPFVHLDPALDALPDDARLWAPAAALLGEARVALFTDKLNFKRPGGAPFPWHQDSPYFAFECGHVDRLVSVQVYLDDASPENGCLWMIPGSHRAGVLPGLSERGVLGKLYTDVARALAEAPRVPLAAPAGSAIFFHGDVVHGSQVNRSSGSRRAFVLTYQPSGHPQFRRPGVREVSAPAG
ncbi:MAG TPA: phytanoyl-CoA dioxygenase family protein [Myxococcota bacterium]|nr:phytanoyl-CoA dioxygenase family protein [Myxococcota bacterium]